MDNEYTVADLISHSFNQQPIEFQATFNAIMSDKLTAAIDNKKLEVAQSMFSDQAASEDYESAEEDQQDIESELDQEETTDGEAA